MGKWGNKKVSIVVISCILAMLLLFYSVIHLTFAWLHTYLQKDSTGTTNLATIDGEVSSSSSTHEVTMGNAGANTSLSNYTLITNNGTMDALVRVFYSIYINEEDKEIATTSSISEVIVNSGFVASDENINNVHSGYYYYNSTLGAGEQISFLTSAKATSETASKKVKINMIVELINYQGGAYQLGQDIPWKNTPASWNFNNTNITKLNISTVSPKLEIKFSEISKVEMTAKTTTTSQNILFCRTSNAYVGMNGSSWTFQQLTGGTASLTPAQFTNGNYNTITFTWTGCTAATDDYITLVWDATWSKEVSYKQIKIWNTDGDLVYDLRPNVVKNASTGAVTADGTFINKVDNTIMPMYILSGSTLTSTTSTYAGFSEVVFSQDFEGYSDGVNGPLTTDFGASDYVISGISHYGNNSLKLTNSNDIASASTLSEAAQFRFGFSMKAGYKHNVSMWVKTTAPPGTLSYMSGGARTCALILSNYLGEVDYQCSDEWTLLSITIDTCEADTNCVVLFRIPTGTAYMTYVDDIVVKAYK